VAVPKPFSTGTSGGANPSTKLQFSLASSEAGVNPITGGAVVRVFAKRSEAEASARQRLRRG
jgi:hypothetical protein